MVAKIDRTGEENINNFGSKMVIIGYRNTRDVDVYFPEYDWMARSVEYKQFKKGDIKCPYERSVYDIGYIGEGKYKVSENGKLTKCYRTWHSMLTRCYDEKHRYKNPTYKDCEVYNEWLCFQKFTKRDKTRGEYPIGVDYHKAGNKFRARCNVYDFKIKKLINKHLGLYNTQEKAFEVYKHYKENHIKDVANYYKGLIPERLYNALYDYEVEIDD